MQQPYSTHSGGGAAGEGGGMYGGAPEAYNPVPSDPVSSSGHEWRPAPGWPLSMATGGMEPWGQLGPASVAQQTLHASYARLDPRDRFAAHAASDPYGASTAGRGAQLQGGLQGGMGGMPRMVHPLGMAGGMDPSQFLHPMQSMHGPGMVHPQMGGPQMGGMGPGPYLRSPPLHVMPHAAQLPAPQNMPQNLQSLPSVPSAASAKPSPADGGAAEQRG